MGGAQLAPPDSLSRPMLLPASLPCFAAPSGLVLVDPLTVKMMSALLSLCSGAHADGAPLQLPQRGLPPLWRLLCQRVPGHQPQGAGCSPHLDASTSFASGVPARFARSCLMCGEGQEVKSLLPSGGACMRFRQCCILVAARCRLRHLCTATTWQTKPTLRICDESGRHSTLCQKQQGPDGNACRCWPTKPLSLCRFGTSGGARASTPTRATPKGSPTFVSAPTVASWPQAARMVMCG